MEWNEDNFDVNILPYTADAYAAKKYAFVSDYARFWILYHKGGVYFDTDVEVIRPMDDVLDKGPFMGFEIDGNKENMAVAPGLGLAAVSGMSLYQEILYRYESMSFFSADGSLNPYTMIPMVTGLLKEKGLLGDGSVENVEGVFIYPSDWFNPFDDLTGRLLKTENTHTIHWFAKSWLPKEPDCFVSLKRLTRRIFGKKFVFLIGKILKNK